MSTTIDVMPRTAVDAPEPPRGVRAELRQLLAERAALERREAALVRRARNEGLVWAEIAGALGVSRQAVHKKHAAGLLQRR
jgi:DNA-directed RNA polymerase specialized sigma24 family protein